MIFREISLIKVKFSLILILLKGFRVSKSDFECKFTNKIDKRAYLLEYFVNFGDTTHFPPAGGRPQR